MQRQSDNRTRIFCSASRKQGVAPARNRARCVFFFFQAEDGIRDYKVTGSSDVCSSDLGNLKLSSALRSVSKGETQMRCVNRKWIQSLILLAIPSFTASAQVATPLGSPTLTPLPIPPGCLTGTLPLPGCDNAMVGTIPRPSPPAWGGATFETVATAGSPFTATWSASGASAVAPAWQGTINVTGAAYPSSSEGNSTTTWNFSTLTDGKLPAGTLVNFGDLDDESGDR